jgi:hypothetical protein
MASKYTIDPEDLRDDEEDTPAVSPGELADDKPLLQKDEEGNSFWTLNGKPLRWDPKDKTTQQMLGNEPIRKGSTADMAEPTSDLNKKEEPGFFSKLKSGVEDFFTPSKRMSEEEIHKLTSPAEPAWPKEKTLTGPPTSAMMPAEKVAERVKIKTVGAAAKKGNPKAVADLGMHVEAEAEDELDPEERKDFAQELAEAKQALKDEKDSIRKQEMFEKLGHALTQLAGGLYGLKHGMDMSGMKFDKTDWDKRRTLAFDEFKEGMTDIQERQKLEQSGFEKAQDRKFKEEKEFPHEKELVGVKETGETLREREKGRTDITIANIRENAVAGASTSKDAKERRTNFNKAMLALSNASKAKDSDTQDTMVSQAQGLLSDAGVEPEDINKIMTRPKEWYEWGGDSTRQKSPEEAAKAAAAYKTGGAAAVAPPAEGFTVMRDPKSGKTAKVPNANVEAGKAKGLEVVE